MSIIGSNWYDIFPRFNTQRIDKDGAFACSAGFSVADSLEVHLLGGRGGGVSSTYIHVRYGRIVVYGRP